MAHTIPDYNYGYGGCIICVVSRHEVDCVT